MLPHDFLGVLFFFVQVSIPVLFISPYIYSTTFYLSFFLPLNCFCAFFYQRSVSFFNCYLVFNGPLYEYIYTSYISISFAFTVCIFWCRSVLEQALSSHVAGLKEELRQELRNLHVDMLRQFHSLQV